MADTGPDRLRSLSAHIEWLEAAADQLAADPDGGVSVRRIARSLQAAAHDTATTEIAANADAIQKATDEQLPRSVGNFLERIRQLRASAPPEEAHVLVVEDNKTVATATAAFLDGPGRTVHVVPTASEAERVLKEREIDAVVLDLILPDRDGRDLLVQLREDPHTAAIPVVVLSAVSGSVAHAECLAVGADDFLEKPPEPKVLRAVVSRLLRQGRKEGGARRDVLTGLANRVGFAAAFARPTAEDGEDGPLALAVIRLDGYAELAATSGQDAADRHVLEVAAAVRSVVEPEDTLGRWDDARLVVLPRGRSLDGARKLLARALRAVSEAHTAGERREGALAFSGGVAAVAPGSGLHEAIESVERWHGAPDPVGTPAGAGAGPEGRRTPRVLLVEDDRVTRTLVRHRLVREGYDVVGVANGETALRRASAERFDLAILDVKVPGIDGFALLERLRGMPSYAGVPIVMLTGMGSEADVIRGLELGADDYMLKPFSPTELLARVRRLLHTRSVGGGPKLQASSS